MSKHYKKMALILIPACAGFCLALALGSAEEPSEFMQEELNKDLVHDALYALKAQDVNCINELFDTNYIHHLPFTEPPLTLDEMISRYYGDIPILCGNWVEPWIKETIVEGDKVVVHFVREFWLKHFPRSWLDSSIHVLSSEMWVLRIAGGKIVEGWSNSEPGPDDVSREDKNKVLVRDAIHALNEDPNDYTLPEQFDPDYSQSGPYFQITESKIESAGPLSIGGPVITDLRLLYIIADGDYVSVVVFWGMRPFSEVISNSYFQQASYFVYENKIHWSVVSKPVSYGPFVDELSADGDGLLE